MARVWLGLDGLEETIEVVFELEVFELEVDHLGSIDLQPLAAVLQRVLRLLQAHLKLIDPVGLDC